LRPTTEGRLKEHDGDARLKPDEIHLWREGWTVKAVGAASGFIASPACQSNREDLDSFQQDFDGSP
jgi:hypothetical protein